MQYISPLALLQTPAVSEFTKKDILLAKKKMLAELELNGGRTVVIHGRELTKNDIIVLFENLQQDDNLQFHVIVSNDFVLRRFLEDNVLGRRQKFNGNDIYNNLQFIEWISPYFFTSFRSFAEECLLKRKGDEWATLLALPLLMNTYYTEEAWKGIEKIILVDLEDLYAFRKSEGAKGWEVVETLVNFRYILMLKLLPQGRFSMLLDEYALVTMQCAIYVFNTINRTRGTTMVENALVIAVSERNKKLIAKKQAEMEAICRREGTKTGNKISGRMAAFLFIYMIGIFMFAIYSSSKEDEVNNNPSYYMPATDSLHFTPKQMKPNDTLTYFDHDAVPPQQELPKPTGQAKDTIKHINIPKNK